MYSIPFFVVRKHINNFLLYCLFFWILSIFSFVPSSSAISATQDRFSSFETTVFKILKNNFLPSSFLIPSCSKAHLAQILISDKITLSSNSSLALANFPSRTSLLSSSNFLLFLPSASSSLFISSTCVVFSGKK